MLPVIESYFSVLMLFGFSQAVLGIYLLVRAPERPFANNLLALLLLAWGFSCYWFFAFITRGYLFSVTMTTLIGPMLALTLFPPVFLYVKYAVSRQKKFQPRDHLHFLPIYVYLLFTLYLFIDSDFSIAVMRRHTWFSLRKEVCAYVATVQGPFYFWKTRQLLKLQAKEAGANHAVAAANLGWFHTFNYGFAVIFLIGGVSTFVHFTPFNPYVLYMAYHAVVAMGISYITVILIKNPGSFFYGHIRSQPILATFEADPPRKRAAVGLPDGEPTPSVTSNRPKESRVNPAYTALLEQLNTLMTEQKLYTNPDLKLSDLAEAVGESRNTISAALNSCLHKTFYEYLNELRLEESKRLLADKALNHYSVEGLAALSGFKTMSVFYRLFKESEKMTPAVYRRK